MIFRLRNSFLRGVLPTIRVLQLEVGIAGELAVVQRESVMLTDVTIRTNSRGILKHQTLFAMLFRDNVNHTCDGIRTVECRGCTLHNFNLLNIVGIDEGKIILSTIVTMQTTSVYQNQYIRVAESVHLHA